MITKHRKKQVNMASIVVIGSSNTDMVIKADHLPGAGETILGGSFFMNPGGKGANQAVACARLGGRVTFITKTGNDVFGRQSVQMFEEENISTDFVFADAKHPSGVALITIDKNGENCIAVASGANANLNASDLKTAQHEIESASIILIQLEIPIATVEYALDIAKTKAITTILNPAPASKLSDELLSKVSIITPNETEASMLSGIKVTDIISAKEAALLIQKKGVDIVIITMGASGALILDGELFTMVAAPIVKAEDTTAAGDVFNGALAVAISEGKTMEDAVHFACKAASISVTKLGAQTSIPHRNDSKLTATV